MGDVDGFDVFFCLLCGLLINQGFCQKFVSVESSFICVEDCGCEPGWSCSVIVNRPHINSHTYLDIP